MLILHNSNDRDSRIFIDALGAQHEHLVFDWYKGGREEYLKLFPDAPMPSAFPSVVASTTAGGYISRKPDDLASAEAEILPHAKADAKRSVDVSAGKWRSMIVSPGESMDSVYIRKGNQAQAWLAATDPDIDAPEFCYIKAEIGVTGQTADEVAQVVMGMAVAYDQFVAAIEAERLKIKAAVDDCLTLDAIMTTVAGTQFPDPPAE